tara:strand:+ start:366 stop:632 length:267 start_codon:yes stop_codon:yes gene_type:complete
LAGQERSGSPTSGELARRWIPNNPSCKVSEISVPRTSGTSNVLWQATYGNSIFVVVGDGGTILTSSDGITWTSITSGTTNTLRGITYK